MPASLETLWPERSRAAVPAVVVTTSLCLGALAAVGVDIRRPGSGLALLGAAVLAAELVAPRRRPAADQLVAAAAAVLLLLGCAVRAAEWLDALCLLGAIGLGTLAVVRGRSWTGVAAGVVMPLVACLEIPAWVRRGLPGAARLTPRRRAVAVVGVTTGLVLLFGSLFSAADPAYAALLDDVVPDPHLDGVLRRAFVLGAAAAAALVAASLALFPPQVEAMRPEPARPVRRGELLVPLATLDLLFVTFVGVQLAVLFGGNRRVLETQGLSYAEYARSGFWELLAVTVLTLSVVAVVARFAPRATASDRLLLRVLLGVLCGTALVIVASALHRMSLYEDAFGFTRLRLGVQALELALGAVLVLVLLAGVRLTGAWLPRGAVAVAAVTVLGLVLLDPDAYVADRNVDRFVRTGRLDVSYVSGLSADAVPALLRLPEPQRSCALAPISAALSEVQDHWYDGNLSRVRARRDLERVRVSCP